MMKRAFPFFLLLLLFSCRKEVRGEYIYRKSTDKLFDVADSYPCEPPSYPWDEREKRTLPKITKEFFRCRGDSLNPVREKKREGKASFYFYDCLGSHGLPLIDGEEFVYPILLDLLNHVQERSGKRVQITTGHRCPTHNSYSDYTSYNYGSKHMIGAEVDFYVEGLTNEEVIDCLQEYYEEPFSRFTKQKLNVRTEPWYNDEVFIKLYLPDEGRDMDNQHPYPYFSIQVRYDRDRKKRVRFDVEASERYLR